MRFIVRGLVQTAVLTTFALTLAASASGLDFNSLSDLYVFGDSIVDAGNTQLASGGPGSPDDPTPAAAGYFNGRFSNGPVLSDRINEEIEGAGVYSTPSLLGGNNYAFGGARARDNSPADPLPDMALQTGAFLVDQGGVADANALYLINAGGNDVLDIVLGNINGAPRNAIINAAASAIASSVATLQAAGAQHIVVMGVGNVGITPAVQAVGGPVVSGATIAALQVNVAIQNALPGGATFFDTLGVSTNIANNPTDFGLPAGTVTFPDCISAGQNPAGCAPFAWFDPIHPAEQVQTALANEVISVVGAMPIPEPGTGILLMLGLSGLAVRQRA